MKYKSMKRAGNLIYKYIINFYKVYYVYKIANAGINASAEEW